MFRFNPSTIPHNIYVIGAGGTGSRLIPLLSQFLRSITRGRSPTGWVESPTIFLVDDDVVETKNILRQNFIDMDVGKPKAVVLAERYSRAYGVNIVPIVQRIQKGCISTFFTTCDAQLAAMTDIPRAGNCLSMLPSAMVIMCVDSVDARRDILNTFMCQGCSNNKTFFIDAGNEDSFGQVSYFTPFILANSEDYEKRDEKRKVPKMVTETVDIDFMPMDVRYYRDLVDTPAQGSCADLNQTLAINAIMATTIMGIVQNYFYRKPMTYNSLSISLDGASFTTFNTFNNFKSKALTAGEYMSASGGSMRYKDKNGSTQTISAPAYCSAETLLYAGNLILEALSRAEVERQKKIKEARDAEIKAEQKALKEAEAKAARSAALQARKEAAAEARRNKVPSVERVPLPDLRSIPFRDAPTVELTEAQVRERSGASTQPASNSETANEIWGNNAPNLSPMPPELVAVPRVRRTRVLPVMEPQAVDPEETADQAIATIFGATAEIRAEAAELVTTPDSDSFTMTISA